MFSAKFFSTVVQQPFFVPAGYCQFGKSLNYNKNYQEIKKQFIVNDFNEFVNSSYQEAEVHSRIPVPVKS